MVAFNIIGIKVTGIAGNLYNFQNCDKLDGALSLLFVYEGNYEWLHTFNIDLKFAMILVIFMYQLMKKPFNIFLSTV